MTHLNLAVDNSADELEICDMELQFILPDEGSDAPAFVRYACDRCGHEGPEALGPRSTLPELRAQAEALFVAEVECQSLA